MEIIKRMALQMLIIIGGLIPLMLFLAIRAIAKPEGFLENVIIYGGGLYFLGAVQFVLFVGAVILSIALWMG
jgi:hypothetical protein